MDKNNNQLDLIIVNQLVAEALGVAYASYCAECESFSRNTVGPDVFFERYHSHIVDFRRFMNVSRDFNG